MTNSVLAFDNFDALYEHHDEDLQAAASALRAMASDNLVKESDHRRFGWLVNHVIGEKEGQWGSAADTLEKVLSESKESACAVQRAVASLMAGNPALALSIIPRISELADCSYAVANTAVQLGVLQFSTKESTEQMVCAFNGLLRTIEGPVSTLGKIAVLIAGSLNNITSKIMDAKVGDIGSVDYGAALKNGSRRCKSIWLEHGNWTNHERSDYLIALCENRLQNYEEAAKAAQDGIRTISSNGSEDVDKAFLLLELARAYRGLSRNIEGDVAREEAMRLADSFDKGLKDWFDSRARA